MQSKRHPLGIQRQCNKLTRNTPKIPGLTIVLRLDLILHVLRICRIVGADPFKLVADIVRHPIIRLCLGLKILFREPTDRAGAAKIEVFIVITIC